MTKKKIQEMIDRIADVLDEDLPWLRENLLELAERIYEKAIKGEEIK